MNYQVNTVAALLASIAISGCTSTPTVEQMKQLTAEESNSALGGNTMTFRADYGRWAEYFDTDDLSGAGKAWGNWGEEKAGSISTVAEDGEVCTVYMGAHDWSTPDQKYCFRLYQEAEGGYFAEVTLNTSKPERQGKLRKVEIKQGDAYGLMN